MKSHFLLFLFLLCSGANAADTLKRESVSYTIGSKKYISYLVYDSGIKGARPGVLIAPEWWGLSQHEKDAADRLARLGYVAIATDLYGNGVSDYDPEKATEMMETAQKDDQELHKRFAKAFDLLIRNQLVDAKRVAAIGFGFGGGLVLDEARRGLNFKAVIAFSAGLKNDGRVPPKPILAEILILTGAEDRYVSKEQIEDFKSEMRGLKAKAEIIEFPRTYASFTNKLADKAGDKFHLPFEYNEDSANQAWAAVERLLARKFNQQVKR